MSKVVVMITTIIIGITGTIDIIAIMFIASGFGLGPRA